jgi:SPP1 gp7 family putative phage head morphogenesis protein
MAGVCVDLNLSDPEARAAIDSRLTRIKMINANLRERLRQQIREGFDAGESVETVADRLCKEFSASRTRSRLIARTELNGAASDGLHAQATKTFGEQYYEEWSSSRDNDVRDSHAAVDGQRIKAGERFSNGLRRPHEPGAPAAEVCNCRCTTLIIPFPPEG